MIEIQFWVAENNNERIKHIMKNSSLSKRNLIIRSFHFYCDLLTQYLFILILHRFVLVKFSNDTVVQPVDTEWFQFYVPGQDKEIQALSESNAAVSKYNLLYIWLWYLNIEKLSTVVEKLGPEWFDCIKQNGILRNWGKSLAIYPWMVWREDKSVSKWWDLKMRCQRRLTPYA